MTAKTRIYAIRRRSTREVLRLVRASTQPGAIARYCAHELAADLPTQEELLTLGAKGVKPDDEAGG